MPTSRLRRMTANEKSPAPGSISSHRVRHEPTLSKMPAEPEEDRVEKQGPGASNATDCVGLNGM